MNDRTVHLNPQAAESTALANEAGLEFEAFFDREKTRLFQALCVVTRNRFEAEELTQEAFIAIYERWDRVGAIAGVDPATGEPVRVRETVRGSRADAERRLTQMLREHDVTGIVDRRETVEGFSQAWLDHVSHRVKPNTLRRYRELLVVHVVPVVGPVRMTTVRPADVQRVIDSALERRSPRTAVNVYRVLSEMLDEAVRWGVISVNAAKAIRPPRAPRVTLNVPDARACEAILALVRGRDAEGPGHAGPGDRDEARRDPRAQVEGRRP